MNKLIFSILNFILRFRKKEKNTITLLFKGFSGSNISPLIDNIVDNKIDNYKVHILKVSPKNKDKNIFNIDLIKSCINKYNYLNILNKSELVISTHGTPKLSNKTKTLNLWHGVPIKGMALMNNLRTDTIGHIKDKHFISTSEFNTTVINSCIGLHKENYFITGYPRNDYLFNEDGKGNLFKLLKKNLNQRVILYMPTFRDQLESNEELVNKKSKNLFGFDFFDLYEFNLFLKRNNISLLLKLHPNEEKIFENAYNQLETENIFLIKSDSLEDNKMDFYKLLNGIDLLITDYSSIYFDYLLLDRPIVFTPTDLESYRKIRGLLLEPYEFWAPGPHCTSQKRIEREILYSLENLNYFSKERKIIRDIIHKNQDGKSTARLMRLITEIMEK